MWGMRVTLGIDGISLMLILLTTLMMPLAVLGGWTSVREKLHSYFALLLVLTTGMLGVFMALDLMLFFVMWELMLVPMYLIIGIWGGQRRLYASLKFFIYTMLGSHADAGRDPLHGRAHAGSVRPPDASATTGSWRTAQFSGAGDALALRRVLRRRSR